MSWPRPPLRTDQKLADVDLAPFAAVEVDMDLSQLRGVFEEFVAQTVAGTLNANAFFRQHLGLHDRVIDWLFPVQVEDPSIHFAVFMLTVSTSVPGSVLTMDQRTCLIECDGVAFGVRDCQIVSKFTQGTVEPYDYNEALAIHHTLAKPRVSTRSPLSGFYRHTHYVAESQREQVRLALQYLFYRYDHLGRLITYLYDGMAPRHKPGFPTRKLVTSDLAKRLLSVGNLMPTIYVELVESNILEKEEFLDWFGAEDAAWRKEPEDALVDPDVLMRWYKTLRKIGGKQ